MSKLSKKIHNESKTYLLIGSPNVGKSTIFNRLTHATALVSNIDRMTTEHTMGKIKKTDDYLVDLPGIYNLSHPIAEEKETHYHLLHGKVDGIVNVLSAFSLQRDLYLTLQCIETGLLNTLCVNMIDLIKPQTFNWKKLSKELNGLNIVLSRSNRSKNVKEIIKSLHESKMVDSNIVTYSEEIERKIKQISNVLPNLNVSKRFASLMILENNAFLIDHLSYHHKEEFKKIKPLLVSEEQGKKYAQEIRDTKNKFIVKLLKACHYNTKKYLRIDLPKQNRFDHFFLKKWIGIPLFIIIVLAIYYLAFGNYAGGWIQSHFAQALSDSEWGLAHWIAEGFRQANAPEWVTSLFVNGICNGVFVILAFIPTICILYFLISIIQQIGLLSRTSILLDRALSKFGISGRSIVNLLTAFGCAVPALMLARSSSSKKERVVSTLITPFISCTTKVVVISFVSNVIFSTWSWLFIYGFVFFSGLIALLLGLFFSKTLFRKQSSFFCIEVVNWNAPDFRIIFKNVAQQIKQFLKKTILIIVVANLIFWVLLHIGPVNGTYIPDSSELVQYSILCYIGKGLSYLLWPVFGGANWQLTSALVAGLPAKELIITNLQLLQSTTEVGTIAGLFNQFGFGPAVAVSFMTFAMFYIPCLPAVVTMWKETKPKYVGINFLSSIVVAYGLSTIVYWVGRSIMLLSGN